MPDARPARPLEVVLTLACADRVGIVHAVAGFLAARGCNIVESQQFGDPQSARFFMRVRATLPATAAAEPDPVGRLRGEFAAVAGRFAMDRYAVHDPAARQRIAVLVSAQDHCLNDLLYRCRTGALPADVVAVCSNHEACAATVAPFGVPFHHLPVTPATRESQEAKLRRIVAAAGADLVVLARYMQVLSPATCEAWAGRAINIHHSFLPGFAGPRPHHQAYERGVKLIGATAHYVTPELDQGPIIEQEVARVDHTMTPARLAAVGRDLECLALARAVGWHLTHRVLLNGSRTVVFR